LKSGEIEKEKQEGDYKEGKEEEEEGGEVGRINCVVRVYEEEMKGEQVPMREIFSPLD